MRIEDLCREVVNAKLEAGYLESNVWTGSVSYTHLPAFSFKTPPLLSSCGSPPSME